MENYICELCAGDVCLNELVTTMFPAYPIPNLCAPPCLKLICYVHILFLFMLCVNIKVKHERKKITN